MAAWGMATAKAKLGEVVHEAETAGPQLLTRSGRKVAMVVSIKEWQRLNETEALPAEEETMADFFMRSPLRNSGVKISRLKMKLRKLDL